MYNSKITAKIPFSLILSKKIEIKFKVRSKKTIFNFETSSTFLMQNEFRNPIVPLVFL